MPKQVVFALQLSKSDDYTVARLGVDLSGDDQIAAGEEVTLGSPDGKRWLGKASLERTTGVLFSLRFIAPAHTEWKFTATSNGAELFSRSGKLDGYTKEWLTGRLG